MSNRLRYTYTPIWQYVCYTPPIVVNSHARSKHLAVPLLDSTPSARFEPFNTHGVITHNGYKSWVTAVDDYNIIR